MVGRLRLRLGIEGCVSSAQVVEGGGCDDAAILRDVAMSVEARGGITTETIEHAMIII